MSMLSAHLCVCEFSADYRYKTLKLLNIFFGQFVEKILEEGTKSPRTIRLAALHLTGLWLSYPGIIKYYVKELKLLSLHGSG